MVLQSNQFVIRTRRRIVMLHLKLGLPLLVFGLLIALGEYAETGVPAIGGLMLMFAILFTLRGISLFFWKCTIEGNHISFRSLFRRKEITFSDIKRVAPMAHASEEGPSLDFSGINLYSEAGKLFHMHGSKDGFAAFVARLEAQNIPGVEDLPKGIEWR